MTPAKNEPVRIDYQKRWFAAMVLALEGIVAWLVYGMTGSPEGPWRTLWLIIAPVVGVLGFLLLAPPLFTHHLAGEKGLHLKMGLLLDSTVPYSWIRDVKETSIRRGGVRIGIGVRYFPITKTLFVTSSFSNLAKITLNGEYRMGRIFKRPVHEIIVSVNYMPALVGAVTSRVAPQGGR